MLRESGKPCLTNVFSGTIYSRGLKFLQVNYENFDCNLTQGFLFMVSINRYEHSYNGRSQQIWNQERHHVSLGTIYLQQDYKHLWLWSDFLFATISPCTSPVMPREGRLENGMTHYCSVIRIWSTFIQVMTFYGCDVDLASINIQCIFANSWYHGMGKIDYSSSLSMVTVHATSRRLFDLPSRGSMCTVSAG